MKKMQVFPIREIGIYERFHRHLADWAEGDGCLAVFGPAGVGKTEGYKACLGNRPYHLFRGRLSPLRMYLELYKSPHQPVVLDDITAVLKDDNFRDMLKSLCEIGPRVIRWYTTTAKLDGMPNEFEFRGPVLIVLNRLPPSDPDVAAILDRCDAIAFAPTKKEIVARMRELHPGAEKIIDLIEELPAMPSLRTLIKAIRWSRSKHLKLVEELLAECGVSVPIATLVRIMEQRPESEWCETYVAETGLTDRTYRRHREIAAQIVECRKSGGDGPNVRPPAQT